MIIITTNLYYNETNKYTTDILQPNTRVKILYYNNNFNIKSAIFIKYKNGELHRIKLIIENPYCINNDINNTLLCICQHPTPQNNYEKTFNRINEKCKTEWNNYKNIIIINLVSKVSNTLDNISYINSNVHIRVLRLLSILQYNKVFLACGQHFKLNRVKLHKKFEQYFLDFYNILIQNNIDIDYNDLSTGVCKGIKLPKLLH